MLRYLGYFLISALIILSAFTGAADIDIKSILVADSTENSIFFQLRVPRVILAFCAGAILSLSGLLFQTLFRNALMTPYTLGVSSGAVLGAGIAMKLGFGSLMFGIAAVSMFGFFGAVLSVFLLLYLARFLKNSHYESLLLLGIALSLFYTSSLSVLFYLSNSVQNDMLLRFTMGSLSVIGYTQSITVAVVSLFLLVSVYLYRYELQLMSISDEWAKLKGVDTKKTTFILLVVSSLAIGILVSLSGPIGFVGLIVPHMVKKIYPLPVNKRIVKTAFFGGVFLVFCDTITRALQTQSELPIGIITTLIGGPFFVYLILSKKNI